MARSLPFLLVATGLLCQCAQVKKPVSPTLSATQFTASDGKAMPYGRWPSDASKPTRPRAVIICVHGLSGAASDFWPVGEKFSTQEMVIYGVQLRGMGNDPEKRERGNIATGELWVSDLLSFTQRVHERHPGVPIFWYGESLGSLIVVHAAATLPGQAPLVSGIILSSPVIAYRHELPAWKYWLIRTLAAVWPGKRVSLESLGDQEVRVTGGTTHKQQMQKTPHYVEFFTLRLFRAVDKLVRSSNEMAPLVKPPLLLFYTPNDVFTTQQQVEHFYELLGSAPKEKIFYPQSYHLILHDVDRDRTLVELERWLGSRER